MPNPAQCESVQALWDSVGSNWDDLGEELLNELFNSYPEMKGMFYRILSKPNVKAALREHGSKIMRKFDVSIGQLTTPDVLADDLKTLGSRHPSYGVIPNRHKRPMRNALFTIVKKHGKGNFDEVAWEKTWNLVTGAMGLYE